MSAPDPQAIIEGIETRLKTVRRLTVVPGVPDSIQTVPLAYVYFSGGRNRPAARNLRVYYWRWGVRVLVNQHDLRNAEYEVVRLAAAALEALEADRTLGGAASIVGEIDVDAEGEPNGYLAIVGQDGSTVGRYRVATLLFDVTDTYP
jgi:hypothetical protein